MAAECARMIDEAEQRKAQTAALFNRLAPDYDAAGMGCFAHFGQRLIDRLGVERGHFVLDVATGRGAALLFAAERTGREGKVVGIDIAEAMADAARQEATRRGLATEVRVMDGEHLQFSDAAFDRVVCAFGLMFFPHLEQALSEMRRVLRPAGRIGVSTWRVSQADDLRAVLDDLQIGGPGEPSWISEPDGLARVLTDAGFKDVEVRIESNTFRYTDLHQYWLNARGTGLRGRLATLDPAQTERVRAALAERVRPHQRPDGIHLEASVLFGTGSR